MKNIAIFASGNGTNCENIIRHFNGSTNINTALVVCNNSGATVVDRAKRLGVSVEILHRGDLADSRKVLPLLSAYGISYIILAGFMRMIPEYLIDAYPGRIVNIHPSLLPKYGGKGMFGMNVHEAVRKNGEKESGITIHLVDREYDRGEIIRQYSTPLSPGDSAEEIARKVHALEYEYYPKTIELIINGEHDE